jgi:DHA2 family methylenomycin A resistance protein-like MFS transporter
MSSGDQGSKVLTLLVSCSGLFMIQLDLTVVNVALENIQTEIGASVSGLQWVVDAYALLFASLMLSAGDFGDLFGHKRVFLSGLGVFVAGSLCCALAPSVGVLIASRVLQGIGAAALLPASLAILNHAFTEEKARARALGLWAGVSGLSVVAGPVLGGMIVSGLGWRWIFWVNLPVGIAAFLLAIRVVKETREPLGRRIDVAGQGLGVIFLAALLFALIEGGNFGWSSALIVGAFIMAGLAFTLFLWVEARLPNPMLELKFFKVPTFSGANVAAGLMNFSIYGSIFVLSLFFQRVQSYSPIEAGLRMVPLFAPLAFLAPLGGRLVGRIGPRLPVGSLALSGVGLLLLSGVRAETDYGLIWPLLVVVGLGLAPATPAVVAAATGSVPPSRAGMASAVNNTARQGMGALGVAILGGLLGEGSIPISGVHQAFWVGGIVLILGAVIGLILIRPEVDALSDPL